MGDLPESHPLAGVPRLRGVLRARCMTAARPRAGGSIPVASRRRRGSHLTVSDRDCTADLSNFSPPRGRSRDSRCGALRGSQAREERRLELSMATTVDSNDVVGQARDAPASLQRPDGKTIDGRGRHRARRCRHRAHREQRRLDIHVIEGRSAARRDSITSVLLMSRPAIGLAANGRGRHHGRLRRDGN